MENEANWELTQSHINKTINIIFSGIDLNSLSDYEKRKIIFEYLSSHLAYDYELLAKIRDSVINKRSISRNPIRELNSVINYQIGICNAISQYYKLLLEVVGIKAYCVICDDGTEVKHQLSLVYDSANDSYSFDDVTSVIVGRGTVEEYFDYDLVFANSVQQGTKAILYDRCYVFLPESYVNWVSGRKEGLSEELKVLPENIVSLKNKAKAK